MNEAVIYASASVLLALATAVAAITGGYPGLDRARYAEVLAVSRQDSPGNPSYRVTYVLEGQEQVIRLSYDPGERLVIEDGSFMLRKLRTLQR